MKQSVDTIQPTSLEQESITIGSGLLVLQEKLLEGLLRAAAIVGFLAAVVGVVEPYLAGQFWIIPFYVGAYALVLLFLFWRSAPYNLRAWAIIILSYIMAVLDFVQDGPSGSGRAFMLAVPFLTALLLRRAQSIFALLVSSITMLGFGVAFYAGLISVPGYSGDDLLSWIAGSLVLLMLGAMMVVSMNYLVPRLGKALAQSRKLARELEQERIHLEQLVAERTAVLARRSSQLEAAAQVSRDATAIQDVNMLLEETVNLISTRFGLYHTGIFLLDEAKEFAVLRAASSEGGQRMLARGHRLRVGMAGSGEPVGIVGYVARQGEPRIALDVGEDVVYFDNPDLPATRSEVALPLQVRGEIVGALDVQSTEPKAFDEGDVAVLQTLADQVAIAISNAQLFEQVQESLDAERRAYGELSRQAWAELLRRRGERVYRGQGGIVSVSEGEDETPAAKDLPTINVPVRVRDQVVATIKARKPETTSEWSSEESQIVDVLAEQLGVALESARLYQDTQQRAIQDRLIGEITTRMRETLDMDTVLKTAAQEVRQALELPEVVVRLRGAARPAEPDPLDSEAQNGTDNNGASEPADETETGGNHA
jgi:GAF domain-containing protein